MVRTDLVETRDHTIHLHDGRTLGYAEYGVPEGKAVFYFGASRLEARFLAEQATQAGVRLIGIDRPGMGLSSFQAGRQLLDWSADVVSWPTACGSTVLPLWAFLAEVPMR